MNLYPVLLLLLFLCTVTNSSKSPTDSPSDLSVNCGSIGTFTARNGREWIGDVSKHKPISFLQLQASSTTSTVSHHNLISADPVPHKTARASQSQFSYAFQVSPGQKILRLHFYSAPHKGFKGFKPLFTVEAGPFILLSNFSPSLTADSLHVSSFSKEFYLSIRENQLFNLTLSPETSLSLDTTYAFINGIEIVSVPTSLSYFQDGEDTKGLKVVGQQSLVYVGHHTALELIHRQTLWALPKADMAKNEAWKIAVDVGFSYMIRLYFSDIGLKIYGTGEVEFQVLINGMNAQVKKNDDETKIPHFRDYIVTMRGRRKMGKRDLLISLYSYDGLTDGHGLLSGFEIFKLTNSDNSLAAPNALPPEMSSSIFHHRNAVTFIAVMISFMVLVHRAHSSSTPNLRSTPSPERRATRRKPLRNWPWEVFWNIVKPSKKNDLLSEIWEESNMRLIKYDWDMIAAATNQFSHSSEIGRGGFGSVYKGMLMGHAIAVKRLKPSSEQHQIREFINEINFLPNLHHQNIIRLLGYCTHREEKLLVYEFMENGGLNTFIVDDVQRRRLLQWELRFKIIMGIAQGLVCLQQDSGLGLIHRDVKSSNILLDTEMNPKICNFGLAWAVAKSYSHLDRAGAGNYSHSETSVVAGTFVYMAPEYCMRGKCSFKSDVYSFGILILEILSGIAADGWFGTDPSYLGCTSLLDYAWYLWNEWRACDLVDKSLVGAFSVEEALRCIQVSLLCTQEDPDERPEMSSVLKMLEGDELLVDPQLPWQQRENSAGSILHNHGFYGNARENSADSSVTFEFDESLER